MNKKRVKIKDLDRLLAENKEALRPMFIRVEILHIDNHYPPGLIVNFDEKPLRLSCVISPYLFYMDGDMPTNIIKPPRKKNATIVIAPCGDGDHLSSFLIWPMKTIPKEFLCLINLNFRVIANGTGYMNTITLT
jgi:hypothetical protein